MLFRFKDSLEKKFFYEIIYCYTCSKCKVTYFGKTLCHFYQSSWTQGDLQSYRKTPLKVKQPYLTKTLNTLKTLNGQTIFGHLLQCNCAINFDNFSILAMDSNKFKLLLRESLLIKRDKPILKWTIKLFFWNSLVKLTVSFPISHDCKVSFWYMVVILFCVLTKLGCALSVMLKRKENIFLKMLL